MRICIDLDGTICELRKQGESYADVLPKPGAADFLQRLHEQGHVIIIHTARNMQTQGHNIGKVMKSVGRITLDWLERHGIHYDEIYFGKPNASLTIDDRSIRFEGWDKISDATINQFARNE